jgi:excisionase family DNA binding protein
MAAAKTSMTLAQAARYLHVGERTLAKLAADDRIPATRSGETWLFRKQALDVWSESQRAADESAAAEDGMRIPLGDLMPDDAIIPELRATDALGVIEEVAARAYQRGWLKNKPWFIGALVDRESLASTAMEGGVAFLHTRQRDHGKIARPFIVLGRSYAGVPFGAPDGRATHLFFLLGLTSDRIHLPILGRLARAMRDPSTVSRLRGTTSATLMRSVLLKEDDRALKGKLSPVEFPVKPELNLEIRKRAIMRVAMRKREEAAQQAPAAKPGRGRPRKT